MNSINFTFFFGFHFGLVKTPIQYSESDTISKESIGFLMEDCY